MWSVLLTKKKDQLNKMKILKNPLKLEVLTKTSSIAIIKLTSMQI